MTAISAAINLDHVSAVVGYEIKGVLEAIKAGNLPQRIAILAESNTANQSGLPSKLSFTNKSEVAAVFGYGSPAYQAARILRPASGDKLGSIPTIIYPIAQAGGAVAKDITYSITGTATKTTTHYLVVNGRKELDGSVYSYVVETGDAPAAIAQKMADAINNVIGAPASGALNVSDVDFTSKWSGVTSDELNITVDTDGESAGLTYVLSNTTAGAGAPSLTAALAAFGDEWNTLVINCAGSDSTTLDALEAFNGNPNEKTGRYDPVLFKPFIAFTGLIESTVAAITAITDSRKDENTNCIVPAPNALGFSFEYATETVFKYATIAQNTPHTDPIGQILKDVPGVTNSGDFASPANRDAILKVGCSTIKLNAEQFEIVDLATTSHPDDEPQTAVLFRWVRDWVVNMNIRYKYLVLEQINVVGKTIIPNGSVSTASDTISPNRWKGILFGLADDLEQDALIADSDYMKDRITVGIGESNANRFETAFAVELTGVARVIPTTNQFTFKFGE